MGQSGLCWMTKIISKIWEKEQVVEEWKTCTIVPLFKKGDAEVCDNYRGISLLSIPSKVLAKILYKRIEKKRTRSTVRVSKRQRVCGSNLQFKGVYFFVQAKRASIVYVFY